ncbi:hypothetical protein [Mesorhizobium sp.]|uniref:hypothetical protein n=1 Tax=Mesorhizobium sp. TaxID=1871066 RepID=UPI000FE6D884|nr:hypothetical protein [Mesorhizobium sp.]RWI36110.1 MAG: hypothetical protein EOR14_27880 [Mesorhizobium sp.]
MDARACAGRDLFLLVFLGFLGILAHFARIVAAFTILAVFALGLLGVPEDQAMAMALIVQGRAC